MMISLNPAGSCWVMAQHWGGLHAITPLPHNWLVSHRTRTGHHAKRQAETGASATGWHGDVWSSILYLWNNVNVLFVKLSDHTASLISMTVFDITSGPRSPYHDGGSTKSEL